MPGNHLSHAPLQAMSRGVLSIATGLRGPSALEDALALTPEGACRNALLMLRAYSPVLQSAINTFGPFAILAYGLHRYWKGYQIGGSINWIRSHFESTVTVPGGIELNNQIIKWMAKQNIGTNSQSLTVHRNPCPVWETKTSNEYIPAVGTAWFKFEGHTLKIERSNPKTIQICGQGGKPIEGRTEEQPSDIVITNPSFFGGVEPIKRFLDHLSESRHAEYNKPSPDTRIFRVSKDNKGSWGHPVRQPKRTIDSVSIPEVIKQSLIKDIDSFFTSSEWYRARGIGWRRGLLFWGPPGTGKTSFSVTIASNWDLPIYILSLASAEMTDDHLEELFEHLPPRCIVLLEDVDAAGIRRENMAHKAPSKKGKAKHRGITLSGLLNVVDGAASAEGRLLILTSNAPDTLDSALVRPGRIDRKVLFGNACREVTGKLFSRIYGDAPGETAHTRERNAELTIMGEEFASKIPEDTLTPAEIQNFLLIRRDSPEQALLDVEAWQQELVLTKSQGRNVPELSGQIGLENKTAVTDILTPPPSPKPSPEADTKSKAKLDANSGADESESEDDDDSDSDEEDQTDKCKHRSGHFAPPNPGHSLDMRKAVECGKESIKKLRFAH